MGQIATPGDVTPIDTGLPEARVLIIGTGGTICMQEGPDGLQPSGNFLEAAMAPRPTFNDQSSPTGILKSPYTADINHGLKISHCNRQSNYKPRATEKSPPSTLCAHHPRLMDDTFATASSSLILSWTQVPFLPTTGMPWLNAYGKTITSLTALSFCTAQTPSPTLPRRCPL